MIMVCPSCDSYVPINVEIANVIAPADIICPACENPFNPMETEVELLSKVSEVHHD